ncbi:SUN domain-containing protein 1 isoform X12 [Sphaerodactylus townsendi]|uniref:SUN domain-containing protein 1 isoform X12 n=1 Tax=Sphaerodactylus townsendi TaxID=933632 RepID=UPI002025EA5F|nr:SUN domain-containing protein 1 isoform X12 [Sphaerodactylus townsendi]
MGEERRAPSFRRPQRGVLSEGCQPPGAAWRRPDHLTCSSYSTAALDFETKHQLDPVFDSPRMSRRSLRLTGAAYGTAEDAHRDGIRSGNSSYAEKNFADQSSRVTKQHKSVAKQSGSVRQTPRKAVSGSSVFSHSSFSSHASDASFMRNILDESSIQEQTAVDHFWGLDDDENLTAGGNTTVLQANGDIAIAGSQAVSSNGYTCNDCSILSERKEVLTTYSASCMPPSRIYSRDRSQKHKFSKAASGVFWWLGTGWYQLVTLISLLNVFLLTRCLPKMFKLLLFLLPLLLLLGLWHWGSEGFLSLLPAFNWSRIHKTHWWDHSELVFEPPSDLPDAAYNEHVKSFDSSRLSELEKQMAFLSEKWRHRDEEYSQMFLLLQTFQHQVAQLNDKSEMLTLIKNEVDQHLKEMKSYETAHPTVDFSSLHQGHEWRIAALEDLLAKLSEKSDSIHKDLELSKARTASDAVEQIQHLLSMIRQLEVQLADMRAKLLSSQSLKAGCETADALREKVDAQIKESVKFVLFGDQQGDLPEPLLQWLTSQFVSKGDLQVLLRDLELKIHQKISLHMSTTNTRPSSDVVTSVVNEVGISGITEAQAHIIVNNALKLYSQDKTGLVDFALESGGGSVLSTRCSETYETKTALISLFGIPLWYFSQSPRVVIQPDMHPGNCWAFKGSQGYLVVRLSMLIYPTSFTLEHIPKTLSPTGNITSAPKDFSVYGLENEYQEEGVLLGQYMYNQDGESLQMFLAMDATEKAFQIVELRILSNWGHPEYTCLYRFRVHGRPAK